MNTPTWSLDESHEIVGRLCWNGAGEVTLRRTVEQGLLQTFDAAVVGLLRRDGLSPEPILRLPGVAREQLNKKKN